MLAIIISRNVGNYNFQKCWQLEIPEMLVTRVSRNVSDYNFQECWQL